MGDRHDRAKSKFGTGGIATDGLSSRDRRERLRQLALESMDVSKDPYILRTPMGTFECKLCGTVHSTEGNYMAHTQGKKHQLGIAARAEREARWARMRGGASAAGGAGPGARPAPRTFAKIGRPGYRVVKFLEGVDADAQRGLLFELQYPDIEPGVQPRYSIMSSYEQRVELPDPNVQYLIFAARPYETVAFKIPNAALDKSPGGLTTSWKPETKTFTLRLLFDKSAEFDASGPM